MNNETLLKNLTLIIPTFNDDERIKNNINEIVIFLDTYIECYEVLLVSNGSSQKSKDNIEQIIKKNKNIKHLIVKESGKGLAIKQGINESKYQNILFIDADCSVEIHELKKFTHSNDLISPFVIGNRRSAYSQNINSPLLRKVSGYFYIKLINILFKINIEDSQCGFKAINKNIFSRSNKFISNGFSFDLELIILAKISDIQISQVPVTYKHNQNSKVRVFRDSADMIIEALQLKRIYKKYL